MEILGIILGLVLFILAPLYNEWYNKKRGRK